MGPDAFDESRFVMMFLTILGVTEILCSFELILEEKLGKDTQVIKIRVSRKLEFCVIRCRRHYLQAVE